MISSKQLQTCYNRLYTSLREYIWPSYVVSSIADLEISVYKSFPDLENVRSCFNRLRLNCYKYIDDDKLLYERFDKFLSVLDESDTIYAKLNTRSERGA